MDVKSVRPRFFQEPISSGEHREARAYRYKVPSINSCSPPARLATTWNEKEISKEDERERERREGEREKEEREGGERVAEGAKERGRK